MKDDQDVDDDGDIQDEDPEADPDGNEADEAPDSSPDGDPDGDPEDDTVEDDLDADEDFDDEEDAGELEDYSDDSIDGEPEDDTVEDDQNVDDDADIQNEDPEVYPDSNEANKDPDDSPDGDPDGNSEDDAIEDDQDVDDDGDIQDEDPEVDPDGNEADEDPDGSPDGDPDGDPEDDTIEDDLDAYEDFDDEEDSGELEDYSDDSDDYENNADSNDEADDETERDQEEEELAEEKANEEAAEEAEHAVSEDANKLAEDEADPVEDENQKLLESQPENSAENNEAGDESNENEYMDDTPEEKNEPVEDIDSESEDDLNDELEDSEEYQDEGEPENYDDEKPVDPVSDTKDKQESPSDTDADDKVSKTAEESEKEDAYRTAMNNMADYLNSHNYGREDYAEYSKDPEWQKLNADLQRSLGMEVTTDVPEASTSTPESGKEVSSTELPGNCVMVNASDIDMTYAQGMNNDQFWNHHGNTKEDYMRVAEKLPDVQQALDSGKSIDELKNDPELGETVRAYYDPDNMIKVEQQPDGSYSFTDDGRHRIAAAQELGYEIPVDVTNAEKTIDSQSNTKISDNPSDGKNNLDSGDGPENPPLPPEGADGPDNPPPPPEGVDGTDSSHTSPEGEPGGPPEKEFGKEQLNVASPGDCPSWVKSSDIKDKLDSIGRPDLSAKVDEAIGKLKNGESKASEEFVSVMREAGNELCKNEDTADCGNALLNLVDNDEQALKVEAENESKEYKGLVQENNKQVEGASEAPNPDDLNQKQDIGSETRENLGSFEQSKWDNLSQIEKEQAVEKLRDSIAEDLQLENKPNIAYYYKESPSDFGGYAASTNTIYINRFNMDNAGETADTIAHESRHCWQHERAENPQTEQDYKFKENFEDYIRPEDDFYEYQCQPVEADARDYAQEVKDAIPKQENASESNVAQDDSPTYKKIEDAPPSETGPPDTSENKKSVTVSELPDDFEGKIKEQAKFEPLSETAEQKCRLAGLEKGQVQKIREIPNGQKPDPENYLSKDTIESHLKKFEDEGCYKVIPGEPVGTVGKGDSLFVCRGSELEQALVEADGDPRKLEKALGMDEGYLEDNPYIVRVDSPKDLRMATGNETNAWQDYWCPGGTTIGGMDEAVVTPPSSDDYSFKPCFENGNSTSIYDDNWKKH